MYDTNRSAKLQIPSRVLENWVYMYINIKTSFTSSKAVVLMWSLLAVLVSEFGDVSLYVCSLYF